MAIKRHKPEEIAAKLRQAEVLLDQGMVRIDAIREISVRDLAEWVDDRSMEQVRGAPYHPRRYHESLGKLTPADVYFGRGQTVFSKNERIKRKTIAHRRLQHRKDAA